MGFLESKNVSCATIAVYVLTATLYIAAGTAHKLYIAVAAASCIYGGCHTHTALAIYTFRRLPPLHKTVAYLQKSTKWKATHRKCPPEKKRFRPLQETSQRVRAVVRPLQEKVHNIRKRLRPLQETSQREKLLRFDIANLFWFEQLTHSGLGGKKYGQSCTGMKEQKRLIPRLQKKTKRK